MLLLRKLFIVTLASLSFLAADALPSNQACNTDNLLQNPSFEGSKWTPWINFHGAIVSSTRDFKAKDLSNYFIANLVTTDTFISVRQHVADLTIGQSYALRFWYGVGAAQQFNGELCTLATTVSGNMAGKPINLTAAATGRYSWAERTFVADTTSKTIRFEFNCGGGIGEVDAFLDDISLVARCS